MLLVSVSSSFFSSVCASIFLSLFFFYPHRAPRDLHSFPTRRSSDLAESLLTHRVERRLPPRQARRAGEGLAVAGEDHPDRKSTRLNSSHVRISYAVFCLKKKKKNKIIYAVN